MKCKECGKSLQVPKRAAKKAPQQTAEDPHDIFSMDLGLEEDAVPSELPPRRKKSEDGGQKKKGKKSVQEPSSKTGLYIGIGVFVLIIVGVGGFFIYQSMNGSSEESESEAEPAVVEYDQFKHGFGGFNVKQSTGWETDI